MWTQAPLQGLRQLSADVPRMPARRLQRTNTFRGDVEDRVAVVAVKKGSGSIFLTKSPINDHFQPKMPENSRQITTRPVVEAIEVLWKGYLAFPPVTLGDTLLLAYELAPVKSPLRESQMVNDEAIRASINMADGGETLVEILQNSASEVGSRNNWGQTRNNWGQTFAVTAIELAG